MNLYTLIDTFMWFHSCRYNYEKYNAAWFTYEKSYEGLTEELRCAHVNSTGYLYTVTSELTPIIMGNTSFLEEINKLSFKSCDWSFFEERGKHIIIAQGKPFDDTPSIERISNLRELKELMKAFPYEERKPT